MVIVGGGEAQAKTFTDSVAVRIHCIWVNIIDMVRHVPVHKVELCECLGGERARHI